MNKKPVIIAAAAVIIMSGCSGGNAGQTTTSAVQTTAKITEQTTTEVTSSAAETSTTPVEERDPALDLTFKDMFVNLNIASKNGKYMGETFEELYAHYMKALDTRGETKEWDELCSEASALCDMIESPVGKLMFEYELWIGNNAAWESSTVSGKYCDDIYKSISNGIGDTLKQKIYTENSELSISGLLWLPEEYDEFVSGGCNVASKKSGKKLRVLLIDKSEDIVSEKDKIGKYFWNSYTVSSVRDTDWFDNNAREDALKSMRSRAKAVFDVLALSKSESGFEIAATPADADIILEYTCRSDKAQNYSSDSENLTLLMTEFSITARSNSTGQTASVSFGYTEAPGQVSIPVGANKYGVIVSPFPQMSYTDAAQSFTDTVASWFANE